MSKKYTEQVVNLTKLKKRFSQLKSQVASKNTSSTWFKNIQNPRKNHSRYKVLKSDVDRGERKLIEDQMDTMTISLQGRKAYLYHFEVDVNIQKNVINY